MKQIVIILTTFIVNYLNSQCIINAGSDVILCLNKNSEVSNNIQLNAKLLTAPKLVTIKWVMSYRLFGNTYVYASDFLNDTTILNPKFVKGNKFANGYQFFLYVTDSLGSQCKDSLYARISYFSTLPDITDRTIKKGETVVIYSTVGRGIQPLKHSWTPNYRISDTNIRSPSVWPDKETQYICKTIDSAGCVSDWGDSWQINVDTSTVSTIEAAAHKLFTNFHNPISEKSIFYINTINPISSIDLFNDLGQKIFEWQNQSEINIGNLTKSDKVYFLSIQKIDGTVEKMKIIRE